MYYYLITFACFAKAMKEGRELANNYVCQNLSVFSITTSSQRNPRPTLDCNSSPARYAQMLWPKLIFFYSSAHSSTSVSHWWLLWSIFLYLYHCFAHPYPFNIFVRVLKLFPNRTRVTMKLILAPKWLQDHSVVSYLLAFEGLCRPCILVCISIPHICHGRHGRRPCKFFLPGVNFYRFNAKNWRFSV